MSSFEAQAALASQATGARRLGAPQINTQQQVIPVAQLTAPAVGAISPFVAPTLDTRAAQDLEQAMQIFQQTGQAFQQLGRFASMTREMAEREDVYREQYNALTAVSRLQERFQKGELNDAIDASPDIESFVATQFAGKEFQTDAGRSVYLRSVANAAGDVYLKRGAERQKSEFAQYNQGVIASLLMGDVPEGVRATPDQYYEDVRARFPWVDRTTAMTTTYGLALKEAASRGDSAMFEQIASQITDPTERTIIVDSQRPELRKAVASAMSARRATVEIAKDNLRTSDRPLAEKILGLQDVLEQNVDDPALREGMMADFHIDLAKAASSPEEYDALAESSKQLSDPMQARVQSALRYEAGETYKKALRAAAGDADDSYFRLARNASAIGVETGESSRLFIERRRERRLTILSTDFAKTPTAEAESQIMDQANARLGQYDTTKSPLENETAGAINQDEYADIVAEIGKVKKLNATSDLLDQVMRRTVDLSPSDAKWGDLLAQSGAVRDGVIDPASATQLIVRSGTMPADLLQTVYRSMQGPTDRRGPAMQFLAQMSRTYTSDALANLNGFSIKETDAFGNMPTIAAIAEIMPTLAGLERDQNNNLTPQALNYANSLYDQAADANQDAQFVPMDATALTNSFLANNVSSIGGFAVADPRAGISPTVDVIRSAVTQYAGKTINGRGVSGGALSDLSAEVASRVMKQWNPLLGSWKPDDKAIRKQIESEALTVMSNHVIPKIGSTQFGAAERDPMRYPTMDWDSQVFEQIAAEQQVNPATVKTIVPVPFSTSNEWFVGTSTGTDEDGNERLQLRVMSIKAPAASADGIIRRSKSPTKMPNTDTQADYR